MQTDQDQVLPVWRKPQPAPLSRIISKCTFQTSSEASWGVGNAFRCDTSPVSCPLPSTPAFIPCYPAERTVGNLDKRRSLESFLPASAGGGHSPCCGFQGAEAGNWAVLLNLNWWPLSEVTFKCFSLNETLAVPSWCFTKSQAGAGKDAPEWKQGKRGPSWAPLGSSGTPPLSCSWNSPPAHKRIKKLSPVLRGFVVVVAFSQHRAQRSKERREYLIAVIS